MCVKLSSGNLNPDPYPSHLTSTYTYRGTIVSRVCLRSAYFVETENILLKVL